MHAVVAKEVCVKCAEGSLVWRVTGRDTNVGKREERA